MNFVIMLAAFFIIFGIALITYNAFRTNIGEGFFLSAPIVVLCLLLGGLIGSFTYGMYALFAIAVAGYLLTICSVVRHGSAKLSFLKSPYLIILFCFFIYCLIVYYNDFIQHIDEFHQWAYAVKNMLETDQLPAWPVLVGNGNTGLFYLFFQRITGYNEQNMYVASSLLVWIGLMLPFSDYQREEWKKPLLYCLIMYFGIYSLYNYGVKNLYVDLPVISWAGGLAGWWMNRSRKKVNFLILMSGLAMIWCFKWLAGPLIALFVLLFIMAQTFLVEKNILSDRKRQRTALKIILSVAIILAVCVVAVGLFVLKNSDVLRFFSSIFGTSITKDKAARTVSSFLTVIMGKPLASKSNLKIAFIPFLIVILLLQKLISDVLRQKKEFRVYGFYTISMGILFAAILLFAYLTIFGYEESIKTSGGIRYLSLYAVYIFIIMLVWLLQRSTSAVSKLQGYIAAAIFVVFLTGVNQKFVPNMTGLDSYNVNGFKQITKVKKQIKKIKKTIEDGERIYILDQKGENEYAKNAAFYYLDEQVSNYNAEPWKFTEDGSITRWEERGVPAVNDLPELLEEGGYTYLWIYRTDNYLTKELPRAIPCDGEIKNGSLYQVIYENENAVQLVQVW